MPAARPAVTFKILIVRVSSLGDVVHNMPMLADLHRYYPGAQIDWVVEEAYAPLVRLNRCVTRVMPFALRRWRRAPLAAGTRTEFRQFRQALRTDAYDLVFDTQGLFKTALVMRMARLAPGGRRIGLANATLGSGYEPISRIFHDISIAVPRKAHAVARARAVAAGAPGQAHGASAAGSAGMPMTARTATGALTATTTTTAARAASASTAGTTENASTAVTTVMATSADFCLEPPPVSPAATAWLPTVPYAVLFHGTARAAKQWAPAHWIEVGRMLSARGMPVLLPWGSAEEQQAAHSLAAAIPAARVLPRLPMMDAVLLAQRAALVVGLDSGLTHIAAAYCRPTVELYCDSPRWKTEGNWSPQIINLGDTGKPPAVGEVLAAIESLLATATHAAPARQTEARSAPDLPH